MGIEYRIDVEKKRIYWTIAGPVSPALVTETFTALSKDPNFQLGFDALIDATQQESALSRNYVSEFALHFPQPENEENRAKWAIVVGTEASYRMSRMLSIMTSERGVAVEVFTQVDEAEDWLDQKR